MIQPFHVRGANARGLDARPRNGKAIALQIELFGECDVLRVEMILVSCIIAGHPTPHLTRCVGESIPDRFALAVLVPCAFVLIRGCGHTPKESFRKTCLFHYRIGDGTRVWGNRGALRRSVATTLRKRSTCNSGQGPGSELTTVHFLLLFSFSLVWKGVSRPTIAHRSRFNCERIAERLRQSGMTPTRRVLTAYLYVAGFAFSMCTVLHGQTITGTWQGTLSAKESQRVVLKFAKADNNGSLRG